MCDQEPTGQANQNMSGSISPVINDVEDVTELEQQQQQLEHQVQGQPQQIEEVQSNNNIMIDSNDKQQKQSQEVHEISSNDDSIVMSESAQGNPQEQEGQSTAKPFEVAKDSTTEQTVKLTAAPFNSTIDPSTINTALQEKSESHEPIDVGSIASFLDIDSNQVNSIDNIILIKLQARVTEFTDLKSEKLVLEVNLEQSTHLNNKRVDMFKSRLTKAKEDCANLKEEKSALEASKFELEKKLAELQMEYKSSNSNSQINQNKLDEIMAEKRNSIELLERKNREVENYRNELNQVQESNSKIRKELIDLETTNQTTSSSLTHTKFKLQSVETQLDLSNKNNDWLNKEIKTISTDFSNYRKEKSSELSTLQYDYDNQKVEFNSLKTRYDNLVERFDEVSSNLDDALVQIKTLNDEKSLNQEEFLKEMSLKDRLVKLLTRGNEDAKSKIKQLEQQLESSKADVANESGVLKTTLDKYKAQVEQSDAKIHQLEETIDDLTTSKPNDESVSATPILSSSAKAAAAKYPGISLSQLYSDFALLKKQLTQERRSKERMQQQIDSFVNELEQKAPLINATKERVELLENELTDLSVILEATSKDKELLEKSYQDIQNKLDSSDTQINSLNKQRIDLARQVQSLLVQVSIRGDSQGPLTPAEKEAFNRIVQGDKIVNESDTDRLISDRLVVFQNVVDLQNKNQELLRITRELGNKLEQEEQTSKSRLEDLESSAVNEAKEAILTLQEEIRSTETKLNSVTRERDMFRSMLSNKGSGNNILTGDLISRGRNHNNEEIDLFNKENVKLQTELKAIQEHFEAVKVESEITISLLNKQINSLSNEKSELAVNLARERSSSTLADERYKALQENIKFAKFENEELRKRSQLLQDSLAKQDLRTQHVAEELVQTKSMLESLRSESSNLKAEKQLWRSIEKRLSEENISLVEEKAKLNALLVNLQTLEREREINAAESQRRLVLQSESLEKELSSLRNKLNENSNELKEALTRKEADSHVYQERIDSLRSDLSSTREELILKKSSIEQLQSQVDTLTSKLTSAESRLSDYQNITNSCNSQSGLVQEALKLKAELEDARATLEDANRSVSEFKSIASAAEDALKSMNETFDNYKENTGSKLAKLESENRALNDQVSVLNDQITSLNNEITEQKNASVKEIEASKLEIETLRSQVTDSLKLQVDYDAKVAVIESSYKQQVAIASEAQQNYDKELQKHAEVAKAVSSLREESNHLKQTIQELSVEARQSKDELSKSQDSWETQRSSLEEELSAAKERVNDLTSQNHILYNQIESLSRKQQTGALPSGSNGDDMNIDDASEELRELISLLRREKEISDAQLEVATRDLKRVSQKLEVVTAESDNARLELSKLQSRDADAERLTKEHEKLMEEINHLNLLRESNTTLRNELHANIAKVKELESKLERSNNKLQPLQTDVVRLNAEITHKGQELKLIMEERDRWKQRSQDIMKKYNRIDPEEHEKIKKDIKALTKRNQELAQSLEKEKTAHSELVTKFDTLKTEAQEKIKRRGIDNRQLTLQLTEAQNELKSLKEASAKGGQEVSKQVQELQEKLDAANESIETKSDGSADKKEVDSLRSQLTSIKDELDKAKLFEKRFNELATLNTNLEAKIKSLDEEVQRLKKELEEKSVSSESSNPDPEAVNKAKEELKAEKEALEKAKQELQKEREQFEADKSSSDLSKEEINSREATLKEQEQKIRAEIEAEAQKKITAGVEAHKNKIREVSREKLEQLAKDRVERVKKESAENLKALEKELNDKAEAKHKERVEELEKKYKAKLAAVGTGVTASGDAAEIKAQLEEQFKNDLSEAKKKSFEEGREATVREMGMRTKLLQGKVEKLTKEKKELEQKLGGGQKNPSVPEKPTFSIAGTNQSNSNSRIPVNANNNQNKNQGKGYQRQQSQQNIGNNQVKQQNDGGKLKRPAADNQAGSKEKKSKSDA